MQKPIERNLGFCVIRTGWLALVVVDVKNPLPRLLNYTLYFTSAMRTATASACDEAAAARVFEIIRDDMYGDNDVVYRLDMYCLPGAGQDECIVHYRAESARVSYKTLEAMPYAED